MYGSLKLRPPNDPAVQALTLIFTLTATSLPVNTATLFSLFPRLLSLWTLPCCSCCVVWVGLTLSLFFSPGVMQVVCALAPPTASTQRPCLRRRGNPCRRPQLRPNPGPDPGSRVEALRDFETSEIHRQPLDQVVLQLRAMLQTGVTQIIQSMLEPPPLTSVQRSFVELHRLAIMTNPTLTSAPWEPDSDPRCTCAFVQARDDDRAER